MSGQVFQALEKSDLGCGAGGGRNNAEVFRLAGLTFLTNANADDTQENGKTLSTFCLFFKLILKCLLGPIFVHPPEYSLH